VFVKNDGRASLLAASLVVSLAAALLVYGMLVNVSSPNMSVSASNFFASASPDNLTLTLYTNNTSYQNGDTILIDGTVEASDGTAVGGVVTILFSCGEWSRRLVVEAIANGDYVAEYIISLGDQAGAWTILASAVDVDGNIGEISSNIEVSLPSNIYYTVSFLSPPNNSSKSRGSPVTLSLQVKEGDNLVDGAEVSYRSPKNDDVSLAPVEGAHGTYSATYIIEWDDPTGDWCISADVKKVTGGGTKVGGYYTIVNVQPAVLQLDLFSPSGRESGVGEQVEIKVRASYTDGTPVEGATATMNMAGYGNIVLVGEGNGVYKSHAIRFENSGRLLISLTVADADNNAGSGSYFLTIRPEPLPSGVIFLLAMVVVVLAIGVSAAVLTRKKVGLTKLEAIRAEKKHIVKLRTEAARKYFTEGSISRETYDSIMQGHARRMAELDKEERKRTEKASKGTSKKKEKI
jgi:hypothetical protein